MSDQLNHECGLALIRLLKPLDFYKKKYGTSTYGTPTYGGPSQPLVRQPVEGSGFAVALRVNDGGATAPYSLKGFQLEYQLGARR